MKFVTILGAGLLVGTALAVIIPEGVDAIYHVETDFAIESHEELRPVESKEPKASKEVPLEGEDEPSSAVNSSVADAKSAIRSSANRKKSIAAGVPAEKADAILAKANSNRVERAAVPPALSDAKKTANTASHVHEAHADRHGGNTGHGHNVIGITLVLGFVLMLIVDQLSHQRLRSSYDVGSGAVQKRYSVTATIGLVVHAAADGIALGAASSSKGNEIQLIVFFAIMLHKAPAAFGLVTFLLHEGLERTRIRKHLLFFALAAPVAAVITYLLINQGGSETLSSIRTTGILMLFSAGTFLYVSTVHVLPEIVGMSHQHSHSVVSLSEPSSLASASSAQISASSAFSSKSAGGFACSELCALIFGAMLPAFISLGHSH